LPGKFTTFSIFKVCRKKVYFVEIENKGNNTKEDLMMDIEIRQRMAAESILENESIRAGLEESGAKALLDWGVECAKRIAAENASLEDEDEYEQASYPRMRALRRMLGNVKNLYRPGLLPADGRILLAEIVEFASVVYGPDAPLPRRIYWNSFVASLEGEPGEKINNLRRLFEKDFNSEGD
jgi:hypothetical protein